MLGVSRKEAAIILALLRSHTSLSEKELERPVVLPF